MAKSESNKKAIVKRLEGIHVRRDGIDYRLIFGDSGVMALKQHPDWDAPASFYWDWMEVARKLTDRDQEAHGSLKPDPHAQPGGVPQGISSTK